MDAVKLLVDEPAGRIDVVPVRHGERLPDGSIYTPIGLCRLVIGYGRPWAAIKADAETICSLWNGSRVQS
ncbi:hypothetical protein [Limnoglobus roseus]|uniref:Uncharacterized protein n=1 Tax=Limnoglobus roseus TaxID=2598579 RepID=A0A5C1AG10_9BACT|nr:hypothetical protein [Limnoglobus roseus]QEL17555.1 hypothetical protein PX52LOC_04548 [Limnoglobus roseus]